MRLTAYSRERKKDNVTDSLKAVTAEGLERELQERENAKR
jgi:hypothetical protein